MWYPVNAAIDGIDAFGSLQDRLKFFVYQRRILIEAMRTKAFLHALTCPEKAGESAARYFELAMPVDGETQEREAFLEQMASAAKLKDLDNMGAVSLASLVGGYRRPKGSFSIPRPPVKSASDD